MTGRILVQWEQDATLPFEYPQLALLVASLVQFSKAQHFAQLEFHSGYTLVVRSDAVSQLSCVVVCRTPADADRTALGRSLDMAHLKSLVVLHEFLRCYRDQVDAVVVESKAGAAIMEEKYTLTSALEGRTDHDSRTSSEPGADCTMDAFVLFQNGFIAPMIEATSAENTPAAGVSDSALMVDVLAVEITRRVLMNTDTGSVLYALTGAPTLRQRHWYLEESPPTQQLLARVARALSVSFPILHRTSLLPRSHKDSCVGFSNAGSVSPTTVVLRLGGDEPGDPPAAECLYIAVQMLSVGTFASVVFFYGANDAFLGHSSELIRSGDLQRVLISDLRGGHLLALVQEGAIGSHFQLHVGSDGAPTAVLQALADVAAPWTKLFDAGT
ncbi:hypothetical protein PybrP1_011116 [[Pythium] brassicae (nom. inval.)]|nr:hypothetical protein PybrP1_011116 [[Pythium] brassicae (nom. inval.)]